ncbi:MAG TPA: hypothetical protein VGN12_16530 [Pirellulales bacterium]
MIDFVPAQELPGYVIERLPDDYLLTTKDVAWLEVCAAFVRGPLTPASALQAVQDAVAQYGDSLHIDPFELLIDSGICDSSLNLLVGE